MTVEDAIAALRTALASGDASAQNEAALALGQLQHVDAAPTLIATMHHASSPTAREIAALELGHLDLPAVIDALLAVLADTSQPAHVRGGAAEGLNGQRDPRVVPALIAALADPEPVIRYDAAFALGAQGDPSAIPALEHMAAIDEAVHESGTTHRYEALHSIRCIRCAVARHAATSESAQ